MTDDGFFIISRYGVKVLKGCVSCVYKDRDEHPSECDKVKSSKYHPHVCPKWEARFNIDAMGKGDGKVKRREYLEFVLERLSNDNSENISTLHPAELKKYITALRKEFEEKNGDIYINM